MFSGGIILLPDAVAPNTPAERRTRIHLGPLLPVPLVLQESGGTLLLPGAAATLPKYRQISRARYVRGFSSL